MGEYDQILDQLDEEGQELFHQFEHMIYKKPEPFVLPEEWQLLCELPALPSKGYFYVEYMQAGTGIGRGWTRLDGEAFQYDMLARMWAWKHTASNSQPARVLQSVGKNLYPICMFFKKNDKVLVSFRLPDGRELEQETSDPYDLSGMSELKVSNGQNSLQS